CGNRQPTTAGEKGFDSGHYQGNTRRCRERKAAVDHERTAGSHERIAGSHERTAGSDERNAGSDERKTARCREGKAGNRDEGKAGSDYQTSAAGCYEGEETQNNTVGERANTSDRALHL